MYLSDHVVKLNLFVNLGLLALIIWVPFNMTMASLDHTYEVFRQEPDDQVEGQQLPVIAVVASAFAGRWCIVCAIYPNRFVLAVYGTAFNNSHASCLPRTPSDVRA